MRWLREQRPRWHIGLAPLADTEFNRYKSDLKWLEYTALGLPVVASDLEPYRSIRDHITGRVLADGDVSGWADALQELAEDATARTLLVERAWAEVTSERLLRTGDATLAQLLLSVERT